MPEAPTPKPTAAELKIYRADFESQCTDAHLTRDNLSVVLERLLKRSVSEIELRIFGNALFSDADAVNFGTFMTLGMGMEPGWDTPEDMGGEVTKEEAKAVEAVVENLAEIKVVEVKTLSADQKAKVQSVFKGLDDAGDGNGKVDADELKGLDKNGKLFKKMNTTRENMITLEAFEDFFTSMARDRGDKAAEGLLNHMERHLAKCVSTTKVTASVEEVVAQKGSQWEGQIAVLSEAEKSRISGIHQRFDTLGDGNGTVEKEEIAAVDKNGKLFAKLDASSSGHVTVEAFQAFLGSMKKDRGEKALSGCLGNMEKYLGKQAEVKASVAAAEEKKEAVWESQASSLTDDDAQRVQLVHIGLDQIGDGNGTVEKEELKAVDKNGKLFAKLDASSSGHVSVEAFSAYFGEMKSKNEKGFKGLLSHMEKYVAKMRADQAK